MYEDLAGKVAVVTGVGRPRGIGRATALRLAREGVRLVVADLAQSMTSASRDIRGTAPDLAQATSELETAGANVLAVPTDVSVPEDVDTLLQRAVEHFGQVDIMVCNAAILADRNADPLQLSASTFARVLAVNLTGTFLCAQAAARHMVRQGHGGSIITIGSRAARRGMPNLIAYASSKFGVIGLTQSLALALAPHRIRVNCVCPGAVDTDMALEGHEQRAAQQGISVPAAREKAGQEIPLGRLTTGDDLAKAIVWFASSESSHLTGQALNVNGGSLMS
jgi:NAD(P)-dependent dehydrogenase (short-subunit alcohol dehydrogenase family)